MPRLPYVELGEARYLMGLPGSDDGVFTFEDLLGSYSNVKAVADFGFKGPDPYGQYLKAFDKAVADYVKAGYMLDEDANAMRRRRGALSATDIHRDVPRALRQLYHNHPLQLRRLSWQRPGSEAAPGHWVTLAE